MGFFKCKKSPRRSGSKIKRAGGPREISWPRDLRVNPQPNPTLEDIQGLTFNQVVQPRPDVHVPSGAMTALVDIPVRGSSKPVTVDGNAGRRAGLSSHPPAPSREAPRRPGAGVEGRALSTPLAWPLVAPVTKPKRVEEKQPPMLNLLVGKQDPDSRYLTPRFFRIPETDGSDSEPSSSDQGSSQSSQHELAASEAVTADDSNDSSLTRISVLDPHAFDLYRIYLRTGRIHYCISETSLDGDNKYTWQHCWSLINAYILGTTMEDIEFADRVMDILGDKIAPGVCADHDTIHHIFTSEGMSNQLRQFVVDRCIDAGAKNFRKEDTGRLPEAYVHLALETALERISDGGQRQSSASAGCEYHMHRRPSRCYKQRELRRIEEKKRARREREKREKSDRGSEALRSLAQATIEAAQQSGVKSIDWADRRNEAGKSVRERHGKTWVGFQRPANGELVEGVTSRVNGVLDNNSERRTDRQTVHELSADPSTVATNGIARSRINHWEERLRTNGDTNPKAPEGSEQVVVNGATSHEKPHSKERIVTNGIQRNAVEQRNTESMPTRAKSSPPACQTAIAAKDSRSISSRPAHPRRPEFNQQGLTNGILPNGFANGNGTKSPNPQPHNNIVHPAAPTQDLPSNPSAIQREDSGKPSRPAHSRRQSQQSMWEVYTLPGAYPASSVGA
ncbi:hypothetical protein BU26DRAFT_570183 [Trematosphaeria pertusa]|uniref:Uncharacterized protein n=1 Tax=Trematosphaeria pertusa TaxID=390896 RepID=A0A6A6I0R7_9PLEO|nr:uncharacterized protein BU26DRAFT_570183 [Trematosphaeria pertusa]KAF2243493.1 hypothetical protein BU26DRAFT_570183 [Trematosphaeria pertusa]